jgi:photosystem II stability/assembly factor-like uncharacterized protein
MIASFTVAAIAVDPLIAEARRRARRRRLAYAAALVLVGLGAWLALGRSANAPPPPPAHGLSAAQELRALERAGTRTFVGDAGVDPSGAGWAMNGLGLWLTSDAGTRWRTTAPTLPGGDVIARVCQVTFVDREHGWISACDLIGNVYYKDGSNRFAAIERTRDAGRTWHVSAPNCPACGGSLSFLDAHRGFALNRRGLFATDDGGATWRFVAHAPFVGSIGFVDARHGWGRTWSGKLYRTADGGRAWSRVPLAGKAGSLPRFGVVAAGRFVHVTRDEGATWSSVAAPAPSEQFSAATPRVWFLWTGKRLWKTTDAGGRWTRVPLRVVPASLWDMTFTSPTNGWAIFGLAGGNVAALARTTNGGRDWLPLSPRGRVVHPPAGHHRGDDLNGR